MIDLDIFSWKTSEIPWNTKNNTNICWSVSYVKEHGLAKAMVSNEPGSNRGSTALKLCDLVYLT